MPIKLQLKRNKTPFTSKDEAMQKLQEQLSAAKVGEMIIATYQKPKVYEYVDLGLPSGLLWAKCNVGAATEDEAGQYFQWGDTQGYTAEQIGTGAGKKFFAWSDYKFSIDGSSSNFSKYNESDNKTVLDPEDDGVRANMGGDWRMPTREDFIELISNTDVYLVPNEGHEIKGSLQSESMWMWDEVVVDYTFRGIKFYHKEDKEKYMFIPAAGSSFSGRNETVGQQLHLWSSSVRSITEGSDFFVSSTMGTIMGNARYYGIPVRGVKEQMVANQL